MSNKNRLTPTERLVRGASIMIALAIVGICFAIARVEDTLTKIVIISVSCVLVGIAAILIASLAYLKYRQTHKRNFFLYDTKKKKDINVSDVDFALVRVKVQDYMSMFKRGRMLYVGELFVDRPWNVPGIKPLLCYELLYELACEESVQSCHTFLSYGEECRKIFSQQLMECRDFELSEKMSNFFTDFKTNKSAEEFCEYIKSQKSHIERAMVEYTRANIDKFIL